MNKYTLIVPLSSLLLGLALGFYLKPENIKEVKVEHTNVVTVIKHVKHPDGSTETTKTTTDKSTTEASKEIKSETAKWRAGAMIAVSDKLNPIYGGFVEHRFIGPIYIGAFGLTNKTVGLTLSFSF